MNQWTKRWCSLDNTLTLYVNMQPLVIFCVRDQSYRMVKELVWKGSRSFFSHMGRSEAPLDLRINERDFWRSQQKTTRALAKDDVKIRGYGSVRLKVLHGVECKCNKRDCGREYLCFQTRQLNSDYSSLRLKKIRQNDLIK